MAAPDQRWSSSRKPVSPTALFFQHWMLWTPHLVRQDHVARGGQEQVAGEHAPVGVGERVPDQVRALRHRDQPDRLVERLRADASAAGRRHAFGRVQRIVEVLRGIRQQNLARPLRVLRVARHLVQDAAVADGRRVPAMRAAQARSRRNRSRTLAGSPRRISLSAGQTCSHCHAPSFRPVTSRTPCFGQTYQ